MAFNASAPSLMKTPIRVGLVGTGFAAKARVETLHRDSRTHLITVAGHTPEATAMFCQRFEADPAPAWQDLVKREDLDLIIICTINRDHGAIARACLEAGKHVIVEYPLSLDPQEAEDLITFAKTHNKLLHVEHIELLGGLHNAIKQSLDKIGNVFWVRYVTINPQHPAPHRWTYQPSLFGFPFVAALSRLHRFIDLFGQVTTVEGSSKFWHSEPDFYTACLCQARLKFTNGIEAEAVYGKGETFWQPQNQFTLYGEKGTLIFTPEQGQLIQGDTTQTLEVGTRRGLFAKDTQMVLDHLLEGKPLYITPEASLYTLKVADAVRRSSEINQPINLE